MGNIICEFSWIGSQTNFVDQINILTMSQIEIGRFGGNSAAGQYKNEDGCLIWVDEKGNFEFVAILDAHNSAESAELVINQLLKRKTELHELLTLSYEKTLKQFDKTLLSIFQGEEFLSDCRKVKGETACLIVLRKDKYVRWFSIGDCLSYLFHSELAHLGQYQINQRQFYEWVGQVNTFEQAVPCYSSGIRELRQGRNRIFLTTDGLVECPNVFFSNPKEIYDVMKEHQIHDGIWELLQTIKENNVRDSTTIISWDVNITSDVTKPSDE